MNKYEINRSIDGHPICSDGIPMGKKEILNALNDMDFMVDHLLSCLFECDEGMEKDNE